MERILEPASAMVRITVMVPGASRALGKRNPEGNHFTIASQCRWRGFGVAVS
jgi:hypothetical protein